MENMDWRILNCLPSLDNFVPYFCKSVIFIRIVIRYGSITKPTSAFWKSIIYIIIYFTFPSFCVVGLCICMYFRKWLPGFEEADWSAPSMSGELSSITNSFCSRIKASVPLLGERASWYVLCFVVGLYNLLPVFCKWSCRGMCMP
jgi:hypothetical protein